MLAAVSENAVTVYALVVAVVVGFGGPVIQGLLASKRQKQALASAKEQLDVRLDAEFERLRQTLAADHRKTTYEAEQKVLDDCAVFISRFRVLMYQPALLAESPEFQTLATELGSHLGRLKLWFADQTEIVQSFQAMVALCGAYGYEAPKWRQGNDAEAIARMEAEILEAGNRYLDAAREHLQSSP